MGAGEVASGRNGVAPADLEPVAAALNAAGGAGAAGGLGLVALALALAARCASCPGPLHATAYMRGGRRKGGLAPLRCHDRDRVRVGWVGVSRPRHPRTRVPGSPRRLDAYRPCLARGC